MLSIDSVTENNNSCDSNPGQLVEVGSDIANATTVLVYTSPGSLLKHGRNNGSVKFYRTGPLMVSDFGLKRRYSFLRHFSDLWLRLRQAAEKERKKERERE